MTNRPHRPMCMHYMRAPAIISYVAWSAVHAGQSHDIVNDTMSLSGNGTKTLLDRAHIGTETLSTVCTQH